MGWVCISTSNEMNYILQDGDWHFLGGSGAMAARETPNLKVRGSSPRFRSERFGLVLPSFLCMVTSKLSSASVEQLIDSFSS